jgi:hypothetical protein
VAKGRLDDGVVSTSAPPMCIGRSINMEMTYGPWPILKHTLQ